MAKEYKNVVGTKINNLEILEEIKVPYVGSEKNRKTTLKLKCKCSCGNIFTPYKTNVLNNKTKACMRCSNSSKLTGQKIGSLTVLERDFSEKYTSFRCICDCGEECIIKQRHLSSGKDKMCEKCRHPEKYRVKITKQEAIDNLIKWNKEKHIKKLESLIGNTFDRLTVLEFSHFEEGPYRDRPFYKCECSCGSFCFVRGDQIGKQVKSCGCLQKESIPKGEDNHQSKHTNDQAKEIRELHSSGLFTQEELSRMFESDPTTISRIIRKIAYKEV